MFEKRDLVERMKRYADFAILISIAALGIALLYCLTSQGHLRLSESIEISILGVLILVTGWYAYSTKCIQRATADQVAATREQAEISRQATEIALNATKNAVMPIVMVAFDGGSETNSETGKVFVKTTGVEYRNIGKGPALNLRVWLEYFDDESGDPVRSHNKYTDVLAVKEKGRFDWHFVEENLPRPGKACGYEVFAEYTDVYKQMFRSCSNWLPGMQSEFSFGRAPEVEEQIGTE